MGTLRGPIVGRAEIHDRTFAGLIAAGAVHLLLGWPNAELGFWEVDGFLASFVGLGYICALAVLLIRPTDLNTHKATAAIGTLFWLGRAGGFLDIVLAGVTVLWHIRAVRAVQARLSLPTSSDRDR